MMNKSLRARGQESSGGLEYGFQPLVIPRRAIARLRARLFGANPESRHGAWFWIPGPREDACPGMTEENAVPGTRTRKKRAAVSGGF
jgi:hypothetical protein